MSIIEKAIKIAGSQRKLAVIAEVSQPAVHKWRTKKALPSARAAILIERATNGRVTRHELRPDIFEEGSLN